MKTNLIWTTAFLMFCVFKSYSQTLRKQPEKTIFPFRSEVYMKRTIVGFDKPENFFPNNIKFNMSLFDKNYAKNIHKKRDYYNDIHSLERVITNFKDSTSKYIISEKLVQDDDSGFNYQQWIKSIDLKGKVIDSLQTVIYKSYDGIKQRMLSTIANNDRIEIEHKRLEWDLEKDDPNDLTKVKVFNGIYNIKNGRFIFQNSLKLGVFFNGYHYGDIYSNINNTCEKVIKSTLADFNNDGINDIAYFLKKINPADCKEFDNSSLIICLADKHGLLQFYPLSILDWDNSSIQLNDLKVINSEINLSIMSKKTKVEYSVIGKLIKNDFKVLKIAKNVPNSPLIFPVKKNQKVENIVDFLNEYEKFIK